MSKYVRWRCHKSLTRTMRSILRSISKLERSLMAGLASTTVAQSSRPLILLTNLLPLIGKITDPTVTGRRVQTSLWKTLRAPRSQLAVRGTSEPPTNRPRVAVIAARACMRFTIADESVFPLFQRDSHHQTKQLLELCYCTSLYVLSSCMLLYQFYILYNNGCKNELIFLSFITGAKSITKLNGRYNASHFVFCRIPPMS